jgi:hypothetical protein
MKIAAALAGLFLVFCLALFFSSRGMLIWSASPKEKVGMLKCEYFTGFGVVERSFLFTPQGFLGRDTCPRFLEIK